jgi:hypothetical protein
MSRLRYRAGVRLVRSAVLACLACAPFVAPREVLADDQPPPITTEQAQAAISTADTNKDQSTLPTAPAEAPPPPPHRKGVVVEQSLGALGFVGKFGGTTGHPALWLQTQAGYEIFDWLYVFAQGNMAFTDTGDSVGPTQNRPIPILGFGGGARVTIHFTPRVAMFVEGSVGGDVAYVRPGVLANFGYSKAESLGFNAGGRLGLEWYQVDRHIALGVSGGALYVMNLAYDAGSDLPLGWNATADLRYTF